MDSSNLVRNRLKTFAEVMHFAGNLFLKMQKEGPSSPDEYVWTNAPTFFVPNATHFEDILGSRVYPGVYCFRNPPFQRPVEYLQNVSNNEPHIPTPDGPSKKTPPNSVN